jgi:membrane protein
MTKLKAREWIGLFKNTYVKWSADDPFRQSATIAYYAIFSLPALLVIVIGLAGFVFGHDAVTGKVSAAISSAMGKETADQIQDIVAKSMMSKNSIWATLIGAVTLVMGATGVFMELKKSLNFIWEVKPKPTKKFLKTVMDNLFSFGLILSIGFLLLVSFVITTLLGALGHLISSRFSEAVTILIHILNFVMSFAVITVLFALMFKILPDAKTKWKYIWHGAILTSFLFILGKYGLALYFGKFKPASTYGAAGSIVLILLWVSYSCMILFFGVEFTKQLQERKEGKIVPDEDALKVKPVDQDPVKGK